MQISLCQGVRNDISAGAIDKQVQQSK